MTALLILSLFFLWGSGLFCIIALATEEPNPRYWNFSEDSPKELGFLAIWPVSLPWVAWKEARK